MLVDRPEADVRSRVGRSAHATIVATQAFADRANNLLRTPEVLRESARHQVEILTQDQVSTRLRTTPISALRESAGRGARLSALEQAGFRTLADMLAASEHQLTRVPGVGPATAQQVVQAARRAAVRVQQDIRFRLDPDRRDPGQTQLLATVAALRSADAATAQLRAPLELYVKQTTPLIVDAKPAGSRFTMLLSRRSRRQAALSALAQLEAVLADPRVAGLQQTVAAQERAADPAGYHADQLWAWYLSDAAAVNAILSTVVQIGQAEDDDAARGFVPEELRQRITAFPLDTSRLTATLRGYQVFGAQYALHQQRSMLGDEMGLGKTVQAVAAIAHLAAKGQHRFLVVCPASVQINWLNEIARHSTLSTHSLHGAERAQAGRRWMSAGGVAVTTFGTLPTLPEDVRATEVAMLVVDEAHFIKNPEAKRTAAVSRVAVRAQRVLFLTGTPMENRVEEFRALVGHLQPRIAQRVDASDAVAGAQAFRRAVAPVYLRRNQVDVLTELPEKIETETWVQHSATDEAAYLAAVNSRNLMAMRQAGFCSPDSAKLDRLRELVEEAAQDGMKVVVFSYFLHALDLCARSIGPPVVGVITGKVAPAERQRIVDAFTGSPRHAVLLAQVEAGGVGINMQAASVVIITEPQWKPSTEDQAIARAHRMGQVRTVQVHRLLAKDSIDERIVEVQQGKRLLFDEFARRSEAKDADRRSVDGGWHRPDVLDDATVPVQQRVMLAERHRLGLT